jgi:hypothetical protein
VGGRRRGPCERSRHENTKIRKYEKVRGRARFDSKHLAGAWEGQVG